MTQLPEWLINELPAKRDETVLSYKDEQYITTSPEGTVERFNTIEEAYNSVDSKGTNLSFDESLPNYDGDGMIFGKIDEKKGTGQIMVSLTDDDNYKFLLEEYEDFLKIADEYEKDSDNFVKSYNFVNCHPAFWVRGKEEKTFGWATSNHAEYGEGKLTLSMYQNDDGSHRWRIETGQHQEPAYMRRYFNPRLTVHADTVEEAFVKEAALIRKFFNNDGTELPDVEYEKQQWVKDLESIIEEDNEV